MAGRDYVDRVKDQLEDEQVAELVATGKSSARLHRALRLLGVPEGAIEVHIVLGGAGANVTWIMPGGKP
jgi:hypothetical protein